MHISMFERCVLSLCAAWLLAGSTAQAEHILIGRSPNHQLQPAVYRFSGNTCHAPQVPASPSPTYWEVLGSQNNDVIVVVDSGPSFWWCGHLISPTSPQNGHLIVKGRGGADIIWGGNGGGMDVTALHGDDGSSTASDGADVIVGGSSSSISGGKGDDVLLIKRLYSAAGGGAGNDLFCTAVSNEWSTTPIVIVGGANEDRRWGPPALNEVEIDIVDDPGDQGRCDFSYAAAVANVLAVIGGN